MSLTTVNPYLNFDGTAAQAIALCRSLGLPHDTHMGGGLSAWKAHGLPVTR